MKWRSCQQQPCPFHAHRVDCACKPGPVLCNQHELVHACPSLVAVDPKAWKKAHAHENDLTSDVLEALNREPGLSLTRVDAGGARQRNGQKPEAGLGDLVGLVAPEGWHLEVETKRTHAANCKPSCEPCAAQKRREAKVRAMGGVYVPDVRSVQQGIEKTRAALAARRGQGEGSTAGRTGVVGSLREAEPLACQETKGSAA